MSPDYILHLCRREDWELSLNQGEYRASSLETEGFIHLSRPNQILWVANQFYQGQQGLVLLWIEPEKLESRLEWDAVEEKTFPHLYGRLNLEAVRFVTDFPADPDGVFRKVDGPQAG